MITIIGNSANHELLIIIITDPLGFVEGFTAPGLS